ADVTLLLRLVIGTERPQTGEIRLFGRDLAAADEEEALALCARVGIVWPAGGFVSNLKTWENILLPLWYHGGRDAADREGEVLELLERLGLAAARIPDFLAALPGSLSAREQRLLGAARALLMDAELMIYAGLFEGLDEPTRERLREETARHHARREGRASLFVAAGPQGLPEPFAGAWLRQDAQGGIVPWP
ncbi:MAG TPA: ATP-binding cassette domain-containing protein, partial [Candidatus Methanoperedens sp.]|nr:ATP-binding cassette domain-containing protein [Candidatus Methanoperedens sp.]